MNEWEQRARARKAYRLALVLRRADNIEPDDWRQASPEVRARTAKIADVNLPSDLTWEIAVDTLTEMPPNAPRLRP